MALVWVLHPLGFREGVGSLLFPILLSFLKQRPIGGYQGNPHRQSASHTTKDKTAASPVTCPTPVSHCHWTSNGDLTLSLSPVRLLPPTCSSMAFPVSVSGSSSSPGIQTQNLVSALLPLSFIPTSSHQPILLAPPSKYSRNLILLGTSVLSSPSLQTLMRSYWVRPAVSPPLPF